MESISKLEVDILRPMTETELLELIQLYKKKGDRYHCMSIYNHYHWSRKLKKLDDNDNKKWKPLKKAYYTHRFGDLSRNGTYIFLQWDEMLCIQFHTMEESMQELKECIVKTKLIDWKTTLQLSAIHTDLADEIVQVIQKLGGVYDYEIPCTCFVLPQNTALNIQVPSVTEGYELRSLQERHADYVHSYWPHNTEASVDFIRGMIVLNTTLGVFRLKDDALIGWIFQNEFYGLGILQVIPEEQGKGFAKLLTLAMTKEIAMSNENDITSFAVVDNVISENIVTKIGFKKHCVTKWVIFKKLK